MRKLLFTLLSAVSLALVLTACNNSHEDWSWDPMQWQFSATTATDSLGEYVVVPTQGATYRFVCKNYNWFWVQSVTENDTVRSFGAADIKARSYTARFTTVQWNADTLQVTITRNSTGRPRRATIGIEAGDVFCQWRFVQQ